jgi:hypothetical protein
MQPIEGSRHGIPNPGARTGVSDRCAQARAIVATSSRPIYGPASAVGFAADGTGELKNPYRQMTVMEAIARRKLLNCTSLKH